MAGIRRSFRWSSEKKRTLTIAVPKSASGFGFTVAWTKPPLVDFISEGGAAEKAGLLPGDKIISIDKVQVYKKGKEEIENIVKNVKEIMELDIIRPEGELATRKRQTSFRRKESFTKKGSRMVIQDAQIMLWKRERALLKLLLCEEDLLNVIQDGKERFMTPLRKQCSLATAVELDMLFGNMEEIGIIHERQVQQLRQLTQGTEDCVGRLYQKQVDERLSILRKYVSGLQIGRILYKYKILNKPFKELIESLQVSEENIELLQFIEKPLNYISDLTTQLAALLSCTAVGHRDYVCLESIVSIYRTFESEMNEVMNKLSIFEDLEEADTAFDGEEPYPNLEILQEKTLFTRGPRDFSLIHPGRYWLFSGQLSKVDGRHYIQYWCLLLSDCLIIARRTEQGVLLVLDEPVMLRSIYQATFDVKNCDSEFRILFALENLHKSTGHRNQWTTWILRASCAGVKLLWQTILTYQLSLFTIEALGSGKASFVHPKQSLVFRGVLPKRSSKYEESSFVTLASGPPATLKYVSGPKYADASDASNIHKSSHNPKPFDDGGLNSISCKSALKSFKLEKKVKDGSYFSLNEGVAKRGSKKPGVVRSKSFGNDFNDSIPFIDCVEEYHSGAPNIIYVIETTDADDLPTDKPTPKDLSETTNAPAQAVQSAPNTPKTNDKLVQTNDTEESSEVKHTPKKKFPRLGTFERIKMEHKKSTEKDVPPPRTCRTRTGTSEKHRRHLSSTVSKEELVKSECEQLNPELKETNHHKESSPRKRGRGFFSRFWKKNSKFTSSLDTEMTKEAGSCLEGDVQDTKTKDDKDLPPDYETTMNASVPSQVSPQ